MPNRDAITLGFYCVVSCDRTGWTGGLLVVNEAGRPLEFRCTLPVSPSRSHQILFGHSLRAHLIGDVIGSTLLKDCRTPLSLLLCQQPEALSLTSVASCPVGFVHSAAEEDEGPIDDDALSGSVRSELADSVLSSPVEFAEQVEAICREVRNLPDAVEPFERIREAIREAHSQLARAA